MSKWPTVPQEHWERACRMRRNATKAERALWRALRRDQLGVAFRRQHPVGPYIVDFVCLEKKLIVEVDGGGHAEAEQIEHDKARAEYLVSRGFRIHRYFNPDILKNLEGVMKDIAEALK